MKGFSGFGNSPAKMYGKKSPAKKELVGDQHNLPEELKAKIEAAPGKMYGEKSPMKQEGPIDKKQLKLQKGEMKGTYVYGRGYDDEEMGKYPLNKSERINDLEDRAEFARSDAEEAEGAKKKQHLANAKKLQHEADIIRNRKSPGKMHGKKSPAKNYKNPQDYKVFNMGNKPTPVKMYGKKSPTKMKDLSGDGKITKKDVLIGRGVIEKDSPTKMYGKKSPAKGFKVKPKTGKEKAKPRSKYTGKEVKSKDHAANLAMVEGSLTLEGARKAIANRNKWK